MIIISNIKSKSKSCKIYLFDNIIISNGKSFIQTSYYKKSHIGPFISEVHCDLYFKKPKIEKFLNYNKNGTLKHKEIKINREFYANHS